MSARPLTQDQLDQTCAVPPRPEVVRAWREQPGQVWLPDTRRRLGVDDGVIIPPGKFPPGTSELRIRNAAAERSPLHGTIRLAVILVDFPDRPMTEDPAHIQDLFFSTGKIPTGSVREYYQEATNGLVTLAGDVFGPYRMEHPLSWYANDSSGLGDASHERRSPIMAHEAAVAADPIVDFGSYDGDGDGYVDGFIVVHAGPGAEDVSDQTQVPNNIWSHKGLLNAEYDTDGVGIYSYLTVPENARIGVCCHELGHLLFGFPDLYDTDLSSDGIGTWCLMSYGSWNGDGDTPALPSAWCQARQGWVDTVDVKADGPVTIEAVENSHTVYRLWTSGTGGPEYFLVENRQPVGYDQFLAGSGLLLWHVDERQRDNTDESHYMVGLVQADGLRQLELKTSVGDPGDPFPGSSAVTAVGSATNPSTLSYEGQDTQVSLTGITLSGLTITTDIAVTTSSSP
jgi:immune inhibitor A